MTISFIEIPMEHWVHEDRGSKVLELFHQLRVTEGRISNGVNAAVERKRHHKICSVIENTARELVGEGKANATLELPLNVKNFGSIPASSYLQLTELLMATTNKKLTSIGTTKASLEDRLGPQWLRPFRLLFRFIMSLFSQDKDVASMANESSVNLPLNPTSTLEVDNHWLSRFSDTPEEVVSKYALFELLRDRTFEQFFGSLMEGKINGYASMVQHLAQAYGSAAKRGAGIVVLVSADVD